MNQDDEALVRLIMELQVDGRRGKTKTKADP